jgi:hypothetical protein
MKRKQQFLRAIETLAPGDQFILKAAQSVPEESLPLAPGGAALELVVGGRKPVVVEKAAGRSSPVRIGFHFGSRPLEMTLPI